jgi:hypothetical protein
MRTALDTLTALALLALAWVIMRAVSRSHSAELQRIRNAYDAHERAHATHAHDDDATSVLLIGEYDDADTLPYADELHDDTRTHSTHATTTHAPDYDDTHADYDTMPDYMT